MVNLIHYAIPGFVILVSAEAIFSAVEKKDLYESKDAFSSMAMGIGNVIFGLGTKLMILAIFTFLYRFRLFTLGYAWWVWLLAFFCEDFSYYLFHRNSHIIRFFWASHVVHHSSRKYNLSTALRQTWTGTFMGTFLFWCWMPLLGFEPLMILTLQSISLLYQFWIHTEAINKMPRWFEAVMNTPSHHRVHHASDLKYLDKNHAGILIIWDKLFGSFQPEEERPTYGLTKNINTFNPIKIAFIEWINLGKDIRRGKSLANAVKYLLNPPGWSHDGQGKTTSQLRREKEVANLKKNIQ
jgi:sterol desaturase/sphingolipid hydroxylase (fatty acid hydroxylase superfamily)